MNWYRHNTDFKGFFYPIIDNIKVDFLQNVHLQGFRDISLFFLDVSDKLLSHYTNLTILCKNKGLKWTQMIQFCLF